MSLSHEDRKIRREEIAAYVKAGNSCAAAAKKYNVGLTTVHTACAEYAVPFSRSMQLPAPRTFTIVKLLQDGWTQAKIARWFQLSQQRVNQIYTLAALTGLISGGADDSKDK